MAATIPPPHTYTHPDVQGSRSGGGGLQLQPQQLLQHLTTTRTALKQADVRIAILEERILALTQVCVRGCVAVCVQTHIA